MEHSVCAKDGSQSRKAAGPADLVDPCDPGDAGRAGAEMDDSALLRRAQSGDQRALEVLCRRCWKPVYRSFARFTGDPADAEDLTQEVFLRALRSLPRFEDRGLPFTAYLLRIASNLARDRWRAAPSRTIVTADLPERAAPDPGPDSLAVDSDRRQVLVAALDRLTPDHRAVLRLRILEGRTTSEVAALTDRSEPAVRQLQVRALAALRAQLAGQLGRAIIEADRDGR